MIVFIFFAFFQCYTVILCVSVLFLCCSLVVKRVHIYEKQVLVEGDMPLVEVFLIVVVYRYEALYAAFGHFVFVPAQGRYAEIGHICRLFKFQITQVTYVDDSFNLCMTVFFNTQPVVNFFFSCSFVSFHVIYLFTNYAAKFIEKCQTSFAVLQVVFRKSIQTFAERIRDVLNHSQLIVRYEERSVFQFRGKFFE